MFRRGLNQLDKQVAVGHEPGDGAHIKSDGGVGAAQRGESPGREGVGWHGRFWGLVTNVIR